MTKKMLRRIIATALALIIVAGTMLTAYAETSQYVPFESYTYWDNISGAGRKLVHNRPMYEVEKVYNAKDLGVAPITELVDVCTDLDGNVYLLDTGSSEAPARIIVLDSEYKFVKEIVAVTKNGGDVVNEGVAAAAETAKDGEDAEAAEGDTEEEEKAEEPAGDPNTLTFRGARNIYVHSDRTIYLCDTENKRVLNFDLSGNYIDEFTLPDSPLIPVDFNYKPIKVVADSEGYVYILSEGSYSGALLYAPADSGTQKEFIGFYGANTVTNNILGAMASLMKRMFPNSIKQSTSSRTLPFTFSDIIVDSKDFIYTATDAAKGQIKKLNPGAGNNIIDSDTVNFSDDQRNWSITVGGVAVGQKITGLAVDDDEFMYALDTEYGRVFVYDAECRMITAFGGGFKSGTQKGVFTTSSAIALKETRDPDTNAVLNHEILVSDKGTNCLTVFRRNDYGNLVMSLTRKTIDGDYLETKDGWEEVLKLDKNLQIAYTGIARAYLATEEYEKAMDWALEGYDRDTYALAYEYHRTNLISKYFTWIFIAVVLIAGGVIAFAMLRKKKKDEDIVKNKNEVQLALTTLIHPGLAFEEMKDKKRGSFRVATVILILFYVSAVLQTLWGGFLFTNFDPGTFNSLWVFVQSAGLVALWVVANWLVTTLFGGKGRMKEIYVVTCYSLMPMIIERVIYIVLTNFLLPTEASFLGILSTVAMIYTGLLLVIGMMRIHDFSATRLAGTSLLTVFGMAAIVFLMILVGLLLQQLGGFISTVALEILM